MSITRPTIVLCLILSWVVSALGGDWQQGFQAPPDAAKPWVYWWWVAGNVTEASITRDLEEMKRKGVGGLLMFDARGYHDDHTPPPPARMEFMSPRWRQLLQFAVREADRLGLQVSVNLSSCAGSLRGPWRVGDDAPKQLVWATAEVTGPRRFEGAAPVGEWPGRWELGLLAVRHGEAGKDGKPLGLEVVDLSDRMDKQGRLDWQAPAGTWTLLRLACVKMEGRDYDVDVLSDTAVEGHFQRMGRAIIADAGAAAGKTLTHFYSVSWEGAAPTWTLGLESHFQRYRGYNPRPYLPVLCGIMVQSREVSDRFLRDYQKTLGDLFRDQFYGKLRAMCRQAGMKWHSESGGPWDRKLPQFQHADQLAFLGRNDMPQGEFWWQGHGMNRPPAMAAHIYGLPLAATEAFTHMRPHWSAYPAALKSGADAAFCDGVNQFIWHTFTASPPEFGKPGLEYFAGTHLNPNVTWWDQAGGILGYLARCQFLLRQGKFVADVCCYTGDSAYQHWGRGERWSPLASLGLPRGFAYDLLNTEVLLERLSVKDGRLTLPDGMSYRLLVVDLDGESVPPESLRKIIALVKDGATVVLGRRLPTRAPGLENYPACDQEVRKLAAALWGRSEPQTVRRILGQGKLIVIGEFPAEPKDKRRIASAKKPASPPVRELTDILDQAGLQPDFAGPWDYAHRRGSEGDLYFIAGEGEGEGVFRVQGKEPEIWDPLTGQIRPAVYRTTEDGRTVLPLRLGKSGSLFVLFRKPATAAHLTSMLPEAIELRRTPENRLSVIAWQAGKYELDPAVSLTAKLPTPLTLEGPWEVRFAPGWGAPESARFDQLTPWNEHPLAGIKFFSGTGSYRKTFELSPSQVAGPVRLQLGEVKYVAQVRLNGKSLGVVWTDPWSVDLTGVARSGKNELEIDVTNLWVNRLIGDAGLPEAQRVTKTNARLDPNYKGRYAHLRGYSPKDRLVPSGLLGPVRLEFGHQVEVTPDQPGRTPK